MADKKKEVPVIAIDGPGGTGKGTLALRIAGRLGWHVLDSGALYRGVAALALAAGLDLSDADTLARLAQRTVFEFRPGDPPGAAPRLFTGGRDLSEEIRTERCGAAASTIAALPPLRQALLAQQRNFRREPGLVADGRDMGTVVFPDAALKIFLTAEPEQRAQRRYKQLIGKENSVTLAALFQGITERDRRDQRRRVSPLKPAPDAVVIDTSDLDADAVEARVLQLIRDSSLKISA
jgi:cytidylate kinase